MGSQERFMEAAAAAGVEVDIRAFPEGTKTAHDAAAAIGCGVAQIVKSLVFLADGQPVLALVGGADRLDERKLAAAAGAAEVRRATPEEVRRATGYPVGGVPPFGHSTRLRCFVDPALLDHDVVWAGSGTPTHVFAADPRRLVDIAGAEVVEVRA